MANEKFSIKEALNYGWETFKNHAGFLILFWVVYTLISWVVNLIIGRIFTSASGLLWIGQVIGLLFAIFMNMIPVRLMLTLHDTDVAAVPPLGNLLSIYPKYLGAFFIYMILVIVGNFLLIVPGIIAAVMFFYATYLTIDQKLGPIDALKHSKTMTDGYKWDLFLFSLLIVLINIGGLLLLGVGLLVTIPTTMLATVYVFRHLSPAPSVVA